MKKWLFVVAPLAMLGVFLVFYLLDRKASDAREAAHQVELARLKQEADDKKKIAEARAKEDSDKRNQERLAKEAADAKEKQDKYDAEMARIQADTDKSNAAAEKYSGQVSELTIELDTLHKTKDTLTRQNFDLAKQVELALVARRNAEMDIQRMYEMISARADQSLLTKMPPTPTPTPKD